MGGINKIKQCWEEYIPKNIRIFLSSKRTLIVLILINMSLCSIAISFNNYIPHVLFGKENAEAKGKMLTTCLSIMGGLTVLYGLWLNNKKLNEQTRQNDITVESNNDKRFGEAVGYLNSDNVGIAIGSIYVLYQLAKDDDRYKAIVANIFLNYLNQTNNNSFAAVGSSTGIELSKFTKYHPNLRFQAIIDCLFDKNFTFSNNRLEIRDVCLTNLKFKHTISNVNFEKCIISECEFLRTENCEFTSVVFENVCFHNGLINCSLSCCTFNHCTVYGKLFKTSFSTRFSTNKIDIFSNIVEECSFSVNMPTENEEQSKRNTYSFHNCKFIETTVYERDIAIFLNCKNEPEFE